MPISFYEDAGMVRFNTVAVIDAYGTFISDNCGNKVKKLDYDSEGVLTATCNLDELTAYRREACVFRDRRPSMYKPLMALECK